MVAYEKASKTVLGLGPPDPAFIARGEQNFTRFAAVHSTIRSEARPGSLANGSRSPIFPSGDWCHQRNAWSFPWQTSPKSFVGIRGSRRCRLGRTLLQPKTQLWPHGSRTELASPGTATMIATQRETVGACAGSSNAAALGAADWLCLAAAPTFAIMALLTRVVGGGQPDMLCSAARDASPLSGMVPMYLLMSAFHSAAWLRLIPSRRSGVRQS